MFLLWIGLLKGFVSMCWQLVFFCQVDFWLVFAKQSADLLDGDSVCVFTDGELVNLPGTSFCVFCIEIWNIFRGTLAWTSPTRAAWLSLCCSKHVIFPFGLWSVWLHYKTQNDHMCQYGTCADCFICRCVFKASIKYKSSHSIIFIIYCMVIACNKWLDITVMHEFKWHILL